MRQRSTTSSLRIGALKEERYGEELKQKWRGSRKLATPGLAEGGTTPARRALPAANLSWNITGVAVSCTHGCGIEPSHADGLPAISRQYKPDRLSRPRAVGG